MCIRTRPPGGRAARGPPTSPSCRRQRVSCRSDHAGLTGPSDKTKRGKHTQDRRKHSPGGLQTSWLNSTKLSASGATASLTPAPQTTEASPPRSRDHGVEPGPPLRSPGEARTKRPGRQGQSGSHREIPGSGPQREAGSRHNRLSGSVRQTRGGKKAPRTPSTASSRLPTPRPGKARSRRALHQA